LNPFPNGAAAGNNSDFDLGTYSSHPSASTPNTSLSSSDSPLNARKFIVPMTNGFNGYDPARIVLKGKNISATNSFGYDISTTNADGYLAYKRGLDALANQDLYDFNMLLLPGVIRSKHSALTQAAMDLCETRGDAFYVMDSDAQEATIAACQSTVSSIDTSYAATYYPWVKILDTNVNLPVWVPPSVVLGGVIAYNDKVAYEWFAPAGLNRGGLTEVLDAYDRVTQSDRDDLYDSNINPIASFPNTGFVVWGQKTLQVKSSALDRINVRRLLIAAKKFIASATKYLVFEQNTSATRNRFLNIANPYLDSVQQRQGLYAFKVVMDETNNTPDVIDRNQMVGAIYLQPTKTAEFIVLDFNILPTGATFPGD
jgi:phage tail sheath protein FI